MYLLKFEILSSMRKGEKSLCRQRKSIKNENNKIYWAEVSAKFRDFGRIWSFKCYKFGLCYIVIVWSEQVFNLSTPFWWGCCGNYVRYIRRRWGWLLRPPAKSQTHGPDPIRPWAPWDQEQCNTHVCWVLNKPWTLSFFTLFDLNIWPFVQLVVAQFPKRGRPPALPLRLFY